MGLTLSYEANQAGVPFGIFFGVSGNPGRFWDLRNAHRRVGYAGRWSRALCTSPTWRIGDGVGGICWGFRGG